MVSLQTIRPANDNQPLLSQAVNGLRNALTSQSWDALLSLTHSWSVQLKKDAWRCLSQEERQAIHLLSTNTTNRLIHGDCIHVMKTLPSGCVDFILTDPPYLVRYKSRDGRSIANDDNDRWLLPAFSEMYRTLKNDRFCVCFYGWYKADRFIQAWKAVGFRPVGHFTFVKSYASSKSYTRYTHENAYLLVKGQPERPLNPIKDTLPSKYTGNILHPMQKPVAPLAQLIEAFSKQGDIVLDPFTGSASTAVAAWQMGRHYIVIEKDPNYHAIAQERLSRLGR